MKNTTDEFSFVLKPTTHGIGVFATHGIREGTFLRLFGNETREGRNYRVMHVSSLPAPFRDYCVDRENGLAWCPIDFGAMHIGWYVNHSGTPNAGHREYEFYALRDIAEGEEVTINYNSLGEPDEMKEDFYRA